MTVIMAIDPGSPHCGVATFVHGECTGTEEYAPKRLLALVEMRCWFQDVNVFVCESWVPMPGGAATRKMDGVRTNRVIGVIEWLCGKYGTRLVFQQPNIKKPTAAILKAHGVALKSAGAGGHCRDAELHGWCYVLRKKEGKAKDE